MNYNRIPVNLSFHIEITFNRLKQIRKEKRTELKKHGENLFNIRAQNICKFKDHDGPSRVFEGQKL